MEPAMFLTCLDADFTRFRQLVARDLTAPVPSCPEWTVDDLARHVGMVYLHKVGAMREGGEQKWPPDTSGEQTLDLLDRGYAELTAEFAARKPDDHSVTWYEPEQTVGFWIRRMAQETVIHRVDAELALGEPIAPIPDDLAVDGVDEVLERFLAYGSVAWQEEFAPVLPPAEQSVLVQVGERAWQVTATPERVTVGAPATGTLATVGGAPTPMLLWLWRRADGGVTREGDPAAVERLHTLLGVGTQ